MLSRNSCGQVQGGSACLVSSKCGLWLSNLETATCWGSREGVAPVTDSELWVSLCLKGAAQLWLLEGL